MITICEDCAYFNRENLECRRRAPDAGMGWASVRASDGCGEGSGSVLAAVTQVRPRMNITRELEQAYQQLRQSGMDFHRAERMAYVSLGLLPATENTRG